MKALSIILTILLAGCFAPPSEIIHREPESWTAREAVTLIAANVANNLWDQGENVLVTITPYFPSVVSAINRLQQLSKHWDDSTRKAKLDALLKDGTGLYIDETGQLWNSQGNRAKGIADLDSLLFRVIISNRLWPCKSITINGVPIMRQSDVPCETPEIERMDRRIALENAEGNLLMPRYAVGQRSAILQNDERLFVLFDFTDTPGFTHTDKLTFVMLIGEKLYRFPLAVGMSALTNK